MGHRSDIGRGAGSGGMIARIGKKIILHGKLSHEVCPKTLGRYYLEIYGDLEYGGSMHPKSVLFVMQIRPMLVQRAMYTLCFCQNPFDLKAIKLFRELLHRYLADLKTQNEIPDIVRECLTDYLPKLEEYSNAKSMLDQLIEAAHKINLENPDEVKKLARALYALDEEINCETEVLIES